MGRLYKPVLGRASGKVGDIVFRYTNGNIFITSHKGTNKISTSTNCVNNRLRFAAVVRFAKTVNKLPDLKLIWKKSRKKGATGYSQIITQNINSIFDNNVTTSNIITPPGFFVTVKDVVLTNSTVSLSVLLGSSRTQLTGFEYVSNFIIAFSDPISDAIPDKALILSTESNVTPSETEFVETSALYNNSGIQIMSMYKKAIVFFAITKVVSENKPCLFSSSYATEILL